jgi:hypothetical protein
MDRVRALVPVATASLALLVTTPAQAKGEARATALAVAAGSVWTTVPGGVVAIDARTAKVLKPARSLATPVGNVLRIAGGGDAIWGLRPWTLLRVDVRRPGSVHGVSIPGPAYAFAVAGDTVWTAGYDTGRLVGVNARTGKIVRSVGATGRGVGAMASDGRSVWVASIGRWRKGRGGVLVPLGGGTVTRVDARSGDVLAAIRVGRGPGALAVGAGAVWVANFRGIQPDNTVTRIDPETNRVVATIALPARPNALTVYRGAVWVVAEGQEGLTRIDPATNVAVTRALPVGYPTAIAGQASSLWIADEGRAEVLRVDARTGSLRDVLSVRGLRAPAPRPARPLDPRSDRSAPARASVLAVVASVAVVVAAAALLAYAWTRRGHVAPS